MVSVSDVPSALQIEAVEADAWAELQQSLPIDFRERLGIHVRRRYGATLLLAVGTRELAINRVAGLGLDSPLSEHQLDDVVSEYAAAGVPRFIIQWSPAGQPARAIEWFSDRGFVLLSRITKLYRIIDGAAPIAEREASIWVEEIEPFQGDLFEQIVAPPLGVPEGLGLGIRSTIGKPGWHFYLAYDGSRPIAGAALFSAKGRGWFGLGATLPTDRCRGAQSALLARRIR